jgi:tetratricopeptide (TPR) repeat protein
VRSVDKRLAETEKHFKGAVEAQKKGDFSASARELGLASKSAPNDANIHLRLASAYHGMRQPLQAALEQEKALHLSPPKEQAYMQLLAAYCRMARFDDADRVLRKDVLPHWPSSSETAYYEGIVHFYRDKGPQALQTADNCFIRSLAIDPGNTSSRYQHAECLSRMGKPAEAEREYREVLKNYSNDDGTYQGLATVLRQQGKTTEAAQMMARFKDLDASRRRAQYLKTQYSLHRDDPTPLRELGDLYMHLEQQEQAISSYTSYLRSNPTDVHCLRRLAEAYHHFNRDEDEKSALKLADALEAREAKK